MSETPDVVKDAREEVISAMERVAEMVGLRPWNGSPRWSG